MLHGLDHVRTEMDGTVIPCCSCNLPMGNINESSMADIWNSPAYQAFRRQTITRAGLDGHEPALRLRLLRLYG